MWSPPNPPRPAASASVATIPDKIEQGKIKHTNKRGVTRYIGKTIQATATLTQLTKLFNWHAARTTNFQTPIVKGMKRGKSAKDCFVQSRISPLTISRAAISRLGISSRDL